MLDLMRDPLWQFIGVIVALVALATTIVVYLKQRSRKDLSYAIISDTPLLSVAEEVVEKVQVLYEGKSVRRVNLIMVVFTNNGNLPIKPDDYHKNIEIDFSAGTIILSAEITDAMPKNIEASVHVRESNVVLVPTLLNSGDSITVKVLVGEYDGVIEVNGRIAGVKDIQRRTTELNSITPLIFLFGFLTLSVGISNITGSGPLSLIIALAGLALILAPSTFDRKYKIMIKEVFSTVKIASTSEKTAIRSEQERSERRRHRRQQ